MSEPTLEATIRTRLAHLNPTEFDICNESAAHYGHSGAKNGAQHFAIRIVSAQFSGIKQVQAHRIIYNALDDLMPYPIHALRIEARCSP